MTSPASVAAPRTREGTEGDFAELARQVRNAGLFDRSPRRALARAGLVLALFGAGWAALFVLGNSWDELIVAVYLAVVFAQISFLGHDIGHRQVFRSRRANGLVGLVCANLTAGISYGYWVDKHDRHHANPNQVALDPDVAPGVIAWTVEQSASKSGLARTVARHQAALFFPLLLLEGANLHLSSVRALGTAAVKRKGTEAVLLAVHAAWYFTVIFVVLSPLRAALFVLVQQGVFGLYLGCAFAPNHKGMAMPAPGERLDFLRRQVTTSRNVRGGRVLDVAMGNLNYQIEHHLFPTMPMANLRRCQPLVLAYCTRHGIDYCETGLLGSYGASLRHLRSAGQQVEPASTATDKTEVQDCHAQSGRLAGMPTRRG